MVLEESARAVNQKLRRRERRSPKTIKLPNDVGREGDRDTDSCNTHGRAKHRKQQASHLLLPCAALSPHQTWRTRNHRPPPRSMPAPAGNDELSFVPNSTSTETQSSSASTPWRSVRTLRAPGSGRWKCRLNVHEDAAVCSCEKASLIAPGRGAR